MNNIPGFVRPGGKPYVSPEGIVYGTDGKLRWAYEIDQRRRPTVLLALFWNYVWLCAAVGLLVVLVQVGTNGIGALLGALLVVLALIGAAAVAAMVVFGLRLMEDGPKLCLLFTLDEDTLSCQQVRGKTDKEKVTHAFAEWVGGQSQPSLRVRSVRTIRLACVTALVADPARNRIRLRGAKGLNTIFAEQQQISTVLDYLKQHCHQVK